jgi:hypothetical protein
MLPVSRSQLKILLIVASAVTVFGLVVFLMTSSLTFFYFSLPNLSLAAFFAYKYVKASPKKSLSRVPNKNKRKQSTAT